MAGAVIALFWSIIALIGVAAALAFISGMRA